MLNDTSPALLRSTVPEKEATKLGHFGQLWGSIYGKNDTSGAATNLIMFQSIISLYQTPVALFFLNNIKPPFRAIFDLFNFIQTKTHIVLHC